MRKIILFMMVWLIPAAAADKLEEPKFYENYHYKVECKSSVDESAKELSAYLKSVNAEIQRYDKSETASAEQVELEFIVSTNSKLMLKKTLEKLGDLSLIHFEKVDFEDAIAHERYQKALLDEMNKEYKEEFKTFYQVKDTESMRKTIDLIHDTSKDIYQVQKNIKAYKNDQNFDNYKVVLQTSVFKKNALTIAADGTIVDANATQKRSVFIPSSAGLGYIFFQIETPSSTFSAASYSGYDIKYMFNNDEQYMRLITANALPAPTVTSVMNKIFMLSYGRNFYPFHFRKGKSFLSNIYSGVDFGIYLASTVANTDLLRAFGTVNIGYELYGNDYFFVDFKMGYFLPFWSDEIKYFRGPTYNLSVNLKL